MADYSDIIEWALAEANKLKAAMPDYLEVACAHPLASQCVNDAHLRAWAVMMADNMAKQARYAADHGKPGIYHDGTAEEEIIWALTQASRYLSAHDVPPHSRFRELESALKAQRKSGWPTGTRMKQG